MAEIPFFLPVDQIIDRGPLKNSFLYTAKALNPGVNISAAKAIVEGFTSSYSESHGSRHNLGHVQHLLRLADYFNYALKDPAVVQGFIWGHDLAYNPKIHNHKERSAELARQTYSELGVPSEKVAKISFYIIATKDHQNPTTDSDLDYCLDMDMAILGAPWGMYLVHANGIRSDYDFLDEKKYIKRRIGFLQETLEKPIFKTPEFSPLEIQAGTNMKREIAWLQAIPTT